MARKSLFVDPATCVMIAEAGFKLWKGAQEARQKKEMLKLLKAINAKLDLVIAKQNEILDELRNLRIYFADELRRQFLNEVQYGMASHRDSLQVVSALVGVNDREALERIKELELPTRNFSFNLLQRGAATFSIALSAAVLHLAVLGIQRELGVKESVVKTLELAFLEKWEEHFLRWFTTDAPDGLNFPMKLLREHRQNLESQISDFPKRISRGGVDTGRESCSGRKCCQIHRERTLVITGDLQTGFADHFEDGPDYVSTKCYHEPWNRWGPAAGAVPELLMKSYDPSDPLSLVSRDDWFEVSKDTTYYENARVIAFGPESSLNVPVNAPETGQLNELRSRWIEAVADETDFAAFLKIVMDTRGEFAERAKQLR